MAKINDWLAVLLNNGDDITMSDIMANGITPDNTSMQSEEYYKNLEPVKEKFTNDNGEFDETAFSNFYNSALSEYNDYANGEFEKKLIDQMDQDPYDWTEPLSDKRKDYTASLIIGKNPDRRQQGVVNAFEIGDPSFSIREVAQANFVRDENGNILDWTPNEKGGPFKSLARPTLALATWDEDGYHEEDGITVPHKKGDYKYDEYGDPYYEELGNRESYNKDVLRWTDTLTVDGTKLNSLDFLDSDGLDKSLGKVLVKTVASIAPLLVPGVGSIYGAFKAFADLAEVFPTLGKAVNGILTGDNDNKVGSAFTEMESYMKRFAPTTSDYSREKQFSLENIGNIFSDSAGQLFSQRQLGKIVNEVLIKGGKDVLSSSKAAQNVALGYMALTSSGDSYEMFKEAGADDRTAGVGMLAMTTSLYGLMNRDYFRDQFFQGTYLTHSEGTEALKAVGKKIQKYKIDPLLQKEIINNAEVKAAAETASKEGAKGFAKFFNTVKDKSVKLWKKTFGKPETQNMLKNMWYGSVNEMTEEIMEEVISDVTKATFAGLNALGIPMTEKKNSNLDFNFSFKDMVARYGAAAFGGFLGGATFEGFNLYENRKTPYRDWKSIPDGARKELIFQMAINPDFNKNVEKIIKNWEKRGKFANKNLSATKVRTLKDANGNPKYVWDAGTESDNQNSYIAQRLLDDVKYWKNLLDTETLLSGDTTFARTIDILRKTAAFKKEADNMGITEDELKLRKGATPVLQYIFESDLDTSTIMEDVLTNIDDIISKRGELEALRQEIIEEESKKIEPADKPINRNEVESKLKIDQLRIEKLEKELEELYKERDKINNGDHNQEYAEQIAFTANPDLQSLLFSDSTKEPTPYAGSNVKNFVQVKYGLKWDALNKDQQESYKKEFNRLTNPNDPALILDKGTDQEINYNNKARKAFRLFSAYNKSMTNPLKELDKKYKDSKFNEYIYNENEGWVRTSNIDIWEQAKIRQDAVLEQINEITNQLNTVTEQYENETDENKKKKFGEQIDEISKEKGRLLAEFNGIAVEIEEIQNNLEFATSSSFKTTQSGDDFIQKRRENLAKLSSEALEASDVSQILIDLNEYYKNLKENRKISDNDYILKDTLNKIGSLITPDLNLDNASNVLELTLMELLPDEDDAVSEILSTFSELETSIPALLISVKDAFLSGNISEIKKSYNTIKSRIEEIAKENGGIIPQLNEILEDKYKDNPLKRERLKEKGTQAINSIINNLLDGSELSIVKFNLPDTISRLETIAENKKGILDTPVLDLIKDLDINIDEQTINILNLINDEKHNIVSSKDLQYYIISDPFKVNALTQLSSILNLLKASVMSANDGYNNAVNAFAKNDTDKLAEIEQNTAAVILEDINFFQRNIRNLIELSKKNTISKAKEAEEVEINCKPKFITRLFKGSDLTGEGKKDQLGYKLGELLELSPDKGIIDLFKEAVSECGYGDIDLNNFIDTDYNKINNVIRVFETKLYNLKPSDDSDFGEKLVNLFDDSIFIQEQKELTNDKTFEPSDYQMLLYLINVFGSDPNSFYKKLIQITKDEEIASPFFTQEFVIRGAWGLLNNKRLYNSAITALNKKVQALGGDSVYTSNMEPLLNAYVMIGGTGVGKTTVSTNTVLKMADLDNVIISASSSELFSEDKLGALSNDKHKYNMLTTRELLSKLYKDFDSLKRNSKNEETNEETKKPLIDPKIKQAYPDKFNPDDLKAHFNENVFKDLFGSNTSIDDQKILVVDEATLIDSGYVQALEYFAIQNNVLILYLGDPTQNSAIVESTPTNIFDFTALTSLYLTQSIRSDNIAKKENIEEMHTPITITNNELRKDPATNILQKANDLMKKELFKKQDINGSPKIKLKYFEGEQGLIGGEKITKDRKYAENLIDKIKQINKNKKEGEKDLTVAVITDDFTNNSWIDPKYEGIKVVNYKQVQGGEYDYVIIDKNYDKSNLNSLYLKVVDLHTLTGRSSKGTIIIDEHGQLDDLILNIKDDNSSRKLEFSKTIKDEFKKWKLWSFDQFGFKGEPSEKENSTTSSQTGSSSNSSLSKEEQEKDNQIKEAFQAIGEPLDFKETEEAQFKTDDGTERESHNVVENIYTKTNKDNAKALSETHEKWEDVINHLSGPIALYDDFGNWCGKDADICKYCKEDWLYNYSIESVSPGIGTKKLTDFHRYLSSIIVDNISDLKDLHQNFSEFSSFFKEFEKAWSDPQKDRIFYFKWNAKENKYVGFYRFEDSKGKTFLIPVILTTLPGFSEDTLKIISKPGSTPFIMKNFKSINKPSRKGKADDGRIEGYYIEKNSDRHLYLNEAVGPNIFYTDNAGVLSLRPEVLEDENAFPISKSSPDYDGCKDYANNRPTDFDIRKNKGASGKAEIVATHNYYYYLHNIKGNTSKPFEYKKNSEGENVYFMSDDGRSGLTQNFTVYNTATLKQLIIAAESMYFALGKVPYNKLSSITKGALKCTSDSLDDRRKALGYVSTLFGKNMEDKIILNPKSSDENETRSNYATNFRLMATEFDLLSRNTASRLISKIYGLVSKNSGFDTSLMGTKLSERLHMKEINTSKGTNSSFVTGFNIFAKQYIEGKGFQRRLYLEYDFNSSSYKVKEYNDFSSNSRFKKVKDSPEDLILCEFKAENSTEFRQNFFSWLQKEMNWDKEKVPTESSALTSNISDLYYFEPVKHIRYRDDEGTFKERYYNYDSYELVFQFLRLLDVNLDELQDRLFTTSSYFKHGIFLRNSSQEYFNNSAFKKLPINQTVGKYVIDVMNIHAPVYIIDSKEGISKDDNDEILNSLKAEKITKEDRAKENQGKEDKFIDDNYEINILISPSGDFILKGFINGSSIEQDTILGKYKNSLIIKHGKTLQIIPIKGKTQIDYSTLKNVKSIIKNIETDEDVLVYDINNKLIINSEELNINNVNLTPVKKGYILDINDKKYSIDKDLAEFIINNRIKIDKIDTISIIGKDLKNLGISINDNDLDQLFEVKNYDNLQNFIKFTSDNGSEVGVKLTDSILSKLAVLVKSDENSIKEFLKTKEASIQDDSINGIKEGIMNSMNMINLNLSSDTLDLTDEATLDSLLKNVTSIEEAISTINTALRENNISSILKYEEGIGFWFEESDLAENPITGDPSGTVEIKNKEIVNLIINSNDASITEDMRNYINLNGINKAKITKNDMDRYYTDNGYFFIIKNNEIKNVYDASPIINNLSEFEPKRALPNISEEDRIMLKNWVLNRINIEMLINNQVEELDDNLYNRLVLMDKNVSIWLTAIDEKLSELLTGISGNWIDFDCL